MENTVYDYIIVGGGPAGVQLAYYLSKMNCSYLIVEQSECAGSFYKEFPRHQKLISINKVHTGINDKELNLRWDWNSLLSDEGELLFKDFDKKYFPDAASLVSYINAFVKHYNLNIKYNTKVTGITKEDLFSVSTNDTDTITAKKIIIATGLHKPFIPNIPGIKYATPYTKMSIDQEVYKNKNVLIVGKGNSAFETADHLVSHAGSIHLASPNPIKFAWKTHYVGHLRAVNNNILDTYQLKSQNAVLDATILSIKKFNHKYYVTFKYTHAENEIEELVYDHVLLCAGFKFDSSMFDASIKPDLCELRKLPLMTPSWESKNIKGLFFAGTLTQKLDYKKYMSGFIHGFRYNARILARILDNVDNQQPMLSKVYPLTLDKLCFLILSRVNSSSALWQQPGFIVDVIHFDYRNMRVSTTNEVTKLYALDNILQQKNEYFLVSLEFGQVKGDPFKINRIHKTNTKKSKRSTFIHPVIRHYRGKMLLSEHHIIEDLMGFWREEEHIQPLRSYLNSIVGASDANYPKKPLTKNIMLKGESL